MSATAKLFLKLVHVNGGAAIKGESEVDGFEGQIELDSWSWALQRSKNVESGAGMAAQVRGVASPHATEPTPIAITKLMDRATPAMLAAMESAAPLRAELSLREDSDSQFELIMLLTNLRITSYELDGSNSDKSGELSERWEVTYEVITFDYKPNPKSATMSVTLRRSARATSSAPDSLEKQIRDLASRVDPKGLDAMFKKISADLARQPPPQKGNGAGVNP
jgi:type VI protein secretion system component Hcp